MTYLNCHSIKEYQTEFRAGLPNKTNKTAICVKKDDLLSSIRTSDGDKFGDIFFLVMELENCGFGEANKILHRLFGFQYSYKPKKEEQPKRDPLEIFRKVKRKRYRVNKELPIYQDELLREYVPMPHINWVREGITPLAFKRFNIGYCFDRKRITIPERLWYGTDSEYVGIMGRSTLPNCELFDIPKYYPLQKYPKGLNIYGLNENYKTIQESGHIVVFEASKSVLKRYSRKDGSCVSVGGTSISDEQVKILIGLNVEIVIAFDQGIAEEMVWERCNKFYGVRNISYIYDRWDILDSKESPADKPNKVYNFMFKHRVAYDDSKRKDYLDWREKQQKN